MVFVRVRHIIRRNTVKALASYLLLRLGTKSRDAV